MLTIPTVVLNNNYGSLMKKEVEGKNREERFVDLCLAYYKEFEQGNVSLEMLQKTFKDLTGKEIELA